MSSVFNQPFLTLLDDYAKLPSKPVEDTSTNQLPDSMTDAEIQKLINQNSPKV